MGIIEGIKSIFGEGNSASTNSPFFSNVFDGEKYPGGMGAVEELATLDYWGLRQRSNRLFTRNAYARGIVRRIVTNVIATGLYLECVPEEDIIGVPKNSLEPWAENVETRFYLFNNTPKIIDHKQQRNGGAIQRQIKTESIVGGDCLVILRQSSIYKLPTVQIIQGDRVQTPMDYMSDDTIVDGVKLDPTGKHLGFYVNDSSAPKGYQYIRAYGQKSGRLQAKLVYGCDKREDGVRGEPLLGIAIQPLAEIDRHRDATQRKATLNSIAVAAVTRSDNAKRSTKPLTGRAANRRQSKVDVKDNATGATRRISFADMVPGVNYENMAAGEDVKFFNSNGVDINFGAFEATILMGLAWALEIPPEILLLSFNKNYSASQAAINEFKIYLNKERNRFGSEYCDFLYQDWFHSMVLLSKIDAGNYLESINSNKNWDVAQAWTMADWTGAIKPATDMLKATNSYAAMCNEGFNTRTRATRELTGQKYTRVIATLTRDNEMLVEALKPLAEFEAQHGQGAIARLQGGNHFAGVIQNDEEREVA